MVTVRTKAWNISRSALETVFNPIDILGHLSIRSSPSVGQGVQNCLHSLKRKARVIRDMIFWSLDLRVRSGSSLDSWGWRILERKGSTERTPGRRRRITFSLEGPGDTSSGTKGDRFWRGRWPVLKRRCYRHLCSFAIRFSGRSRRPQHHRLVWQQPVGSSPFERSDI